MKKFNEWTSVKIDEGYNPKDLKKGINYIIFSGIKDSIDIQTIYDKNLNTMGNNISKAFNDSALCENKNQANEQQMELLEKGVSSIVAAIFVDSIGSTRYSGFNIAVFGIKK